MMKARDLLLTLTVALCLSCAVSSPVAAQPDSLAFESFSISLSYHVTPMGEWWGEDASVRVYDPKGGGNISRFRLVSPEGTVYEKTAPPPAAWGWWIDGDYVNLICGSGWLTSVPDFGQYELTVWNLDGDSVDVTSTETDHIPDAVPTILSPAHNAVLTDTQPTISWQPAPEYSPYPITQFAVAVNGPPDEREGEFYPGTWHRYVPPCPQPAVRFNDDGTAVIPELTPGATYDMTIWQHSEFCIDPGGDGRPAEYYYDCGEASSDFTVASSSLTSFEGERYPWAGFAAGPDEAAIWREPFTPEGAHSATFAPVADVAGQGISGLKLELPVSPSEPAGASLRSWVYVDERSLGDSSCFVGFTFSEDYPDSTTGWSQAVGWEVLSGTESRFQLLGATQPTSVGLAEGGWHLVRVNYHRANDALRVWLDGVLIGDVVASGAGGQAPHYAVLGALGQSATARHLLRLDDVSILPMLDVEWPEDTHLFGRVEGLEQVVEGEQYQYEIRYGHGYPALGLDPLEEELPAAMYVGVSLPPGYGCLGADPAPDRVVGGAVVWEVNTPVFGQEGYLYLEARTPTGLPAATPETLYLWATDDAGAATSTPPDPPNWTSPGDATWGWPQDVLPQLIWPAEEAVPDVWVRKDGPRYASPGDTINYAITVGNRGLAPATDVTVRDQLPDLLGDGDQLLASLELAPGETWTGMLSEELPWGVAHGTLLLNLAYVPTCPAEVNLDNNESLKQTTTLAAHDPNAIAVSPEGGVDRSGALTYTVECENTGAGTAYGVYVTAVLDSKLDATTLSLPAGLAYEPSSRTILWNVGTLAAGAGASVSFDVQVAANAHRARPIIEQAVVYFPSVPEETPTNIVVNVVTSTFSDVPWDFWAILQIEQTYENDIVRGYDDGTYRPSEAVTRDQMAVYMAKALHLPTGPYEGWFIDDVPITQWAWPWIEALAREDLVQGYDATHYDPSAAVTRDQMAVYVARALAGGMAIPTGPAVGKFVDVPDADPGPVHWAYDEVEYCVARGVVAGYDPTHYVPAAQVDRGQMAVYVTRAFRLPM